MSSPPVPVRHVPFIDGLRAIAVLSVIIYHLHGAWLPGGFTGVDTFFVLSGYVVSLSMAGQASTPILPFLGYFYARRLFRIAPALIACLLVTTIAAVLFIPYSWLSGTVHQTSTQAFFGLSNFTLAGSDNDYFSPRVDYNPFTHTWSLGVEEQFYLLFPWFFILWLNDRRHLAMGLAAAGLALSLVWAWHLHIVDQTHAFYMLTSRFWELAAGMLLVQTRTLNLRSLPGIIRIPGAWASLALLAAGLIFTTPASTPYPGGLLPVLGTAGLLLCLSGEAPSLLRRILETTPALYLGRISYSLYLWHWPVFVLFRWTTGLQCWPEYCCALALVFALSSLSYHLIETPPRRLLPRLRAPRYVPILIGLAALGLGSALASLTWGLQPQLSLSTVTRHAPDWYPDRLPPQQNTACGLKQSRFKIPGMTVFRYQGTRCAPGPRIFIAGDSHAAAYNAMAKLLALDHGADVYEYSAGGCSFLSLLFPPTPACTTISTAALQDILTKARPGDILFLPALRIPRLADQFTLASLAAVQAQANAAAPIRSAEIAAALPLLRQFAANNVTIVLEAPTPIFPAPTFRCADWFNRTNPICAGGSTIPRAAIESLRAPVLQGFAQLQTAIPAIEIWDPLPLLCPGQICSAYDGTKPLFFDADHLSGYANRKLAPSFAAYLRQPTAAAPSL